MLVSKNSFLKRSSFHAVRVRYYPQKRKEFASNSSSPNKPLGTVIPLCWAKARAPAKARCFPGPLNLSQRCKDGHHSTWVVIQQWKTLSDKGWQTFSVKGQISNILGFEGHIVPVTATQFCCSTKEAVDKM